ncbi:MAG TPA: glucose-1-phosphate adenylyltransferase [Burkholderiales bacterium]|nr:glucose-1-phosphate adenylyltransferase [Burkholderiales bacterium]
MKKTSVLAFVMAGGEGSRLHPLTAERSKPSVPFGARYRIIDFVLSNLINSGIHSIYLLVQYKSQSLIEHVRKAWVLSPIISEQFVTIVPPQMRESQDWFQGTADAVYQNLNLIQQHAPDLVCVFGADHLYRMDVRQMVDFHVERNAEVTIAALPVPIHRASAFGVIATDDDGRVRKFLEKPKNPPAMPGDASCSYASMGNYLFGADVLCDTLKIAHDNKENDFGRHVLPRMLKTHRVFAYDFACNQIPGVKPFEEQAYWRDVGTIDAYFDAHQDVIGLTPRFHVFNPRWPIFSSNYQGPVAKVISGEIVNSIMAGGTIVNGARMRDSILRREVMLEPDVELDNCIIMDYVHIQGGSRLKRVIVDRYNVIPGRTQIGYDRDADSKRWSVTDSGITVVQRGKRKLGPTFLS